MNADSRNRERRKVATCVVCYCFATRLRGQVIGDVCINREKDHMTHRRETTSANRAPSFLHTQPAPFCARCNLARIFILILLPRTHTRAYFCARKSREDIIDSIRAQSPNRFPLIARVNAKKFFFVAYVGRVTCK